MSDKYLEINQLSGGYEASQVLFDISFGIPRTGVTAIVGRNGAGKSTLLQTIMGFIKPTSGSISHEGVDITNSSTYSRTRLGIGYVPQDRPVFSDLTVRENLIIGASRLPRDQRSNLAPVLEIFPKLADRLDQKAGTMSGGERKMVGIARALIGQPKLLVMDEPTEGVWHGVVDEIKDRLIIYGKTNAILIVEQNLDFISAISSQILLIERGVISQRVSTSEKSELELLRKKLTV
ncbi:MAG: ABC transporter ATP-binding protein [Candidatus Nanopelagicales bacterium]|nr:ABC transporter ATP-binding protein [Candidatus Nanopelagicales bacterium]